MRMLSESSAESLLHTRSTETINIWGIHVAYNSEGLRALLSPFILFCALSGFIFIRACLVVIYRLYFHPLSKFPGPKLAASTRLYELYYAGIRGSFPEKIQKLHKIYGPIVRINPSELSINDSAFNVEYFGKDRKLSKDPWYYGIGFTNSLVTLVDKKTHKERQNVMSTHFSGTYFQQAFPMISTEIQLLCRVFEQHARGKETLNVSKVYRKMANEILRRFLISNDHPSKDFGGDAEVVHHPLLRSITWVRHFKLLHKMHFIIPTWIYHWAYPLGQYAREASFEVRRLVREYDRNVGKGEGLLYRLVDGSPYQDKDSEAAFEDFMEILWGGREVIGHAMTTISYYLMADPELMQRLHAELAKAKRTMDLSTAPYGELQSLPYLDAVCKEGLRLIRGGDFRMPRVNKDAFVYQNWVIPAQTPVSMSPNFAHDDPDVFINPSEFRPERWLVEEDRKHLEHYWKPFGNGSRSCGGRNMALEVFYRTTANIFSTYSMRFEGLGAKECKNEGMLNIFPDQSSIGLNVLVERH